MTSIQVQILPKKVKDYDLAKKILLPTENFFECISSDKKKLHSNECKKVTNYYCQNLVEHFPENTPISIYIRCKTVINNEVYN